MNERGLQVWQGADGWHVQIDVGARERVFATREEAITYSELAISDGRSSAQAQVRSGDVAVPRTQPEKTDEAG